MPLFVQKGDKKRKNISKWRIIMKKLAILSILVVIIISGCVQKTDLATNVSNGTDISNNTDVKTETKSNVSGGSDTNPGTKIGVKNGNLNMSDESIVSSGSGPGWCIPGNKITVSGEEFVIAGSVTYKGQSNICKAEKVTENGSSTIYYNEGYVNNGNNKFLDMESTGKNAKASVIVTVGN